MTYTKIITRSLLLTASLLLFNACYQSKRIQINYDKVITINDHEKIAFTYDSTSNLYIRPVIIFGDRQHELISFDGRSNANYKVSPNKKFVVLDRIVGNELGNQQISSVIINIPDNIISRYLSTTVEEGRWNSQNEWLNHSGAIVFKGNFHE